MDDQVKADGGFDQWVDSAAKFLREKRHGSHLTILIHSGPGQVEAMYSTPDPVIVLGMMDIARLSIENHLKVSMSIQTQTQSSGINFGMDKLKVN